MQFNQDQIAAIIGQKELELIALRLTANQQAERIAELEVKYGERSKEPAKPQDG